MWKAQDCLHNLTAAHASLNHGFLSAWVLCFLKPTDPKTVRQNTKQPTRLGATSPWQDSLGRIRERTASALHITLASPASHPRAHG